jgi:hypothetical protein
MHRLVVPLFGLALALDFASAMAAPHRKVLSAPEIKKIFTGKVATDRVHWAYHLKPDGTIPGDEMGRSRKGRWAIRHNQLCFSTPLDAPEDGWIVVRLDGNLVFHRNGVDVMDVTVEKLSSKYHFD